MATNAKTVSGTRRPVGSRPARLFGPVAFSVALVVFFVAVLLPIYYIFLGAFASDTNVFTKPLNYLPQGVGLARYKEIFSAIPVGRYLMNTLFLATVSTLISLAVCFLAAYAIARLRFPGANLVLLGLLLSSMLPPVSSVIPLFQMYQRLHLMNTLHGLILLYVSALLPLTTWVLGSFIKQIPAEIEDAARVDGAGFPSLIGQVVLPLILPAMATLFLINFIVNWNEFFTPLIFARGEGTKVITMAISEAGAIGGVESEYYQNWGNMSAVAIIATIPVFAIALAFQRRITAGITSGAVK